MKENKLYCPECKEYALEIVEETKVRYKLFLHEWNKNTYQVKEMDKKPMIERIILCNKCGYMFNDQLEEVIDIEKYSIH